MSELTKETLIRYRWSLHIWRILFGWHISHLWHSSVSQVGSIEREIIITQERGSSRGAIMSKSRHWRKKVEPSELKVWKFQIPGNFKATWSRPLPLTRAEEPPPSSKLSIDSIWGKLTFVLLRICPTTPHYFRTQFQHSCDQSRTVSVPKENSFKLILHTLLTLSVGIRGHDGNGAWGWWIEESFSFCLYMENLLTWWHNDLVSYEFTASVMTLDSMFWQGHVTPVLILCWDRSMKLGHNDSLIRMVEWLQFPWHGTKKGQKVQGCHNVRKDWLYRTQHLYKSTSLWSPGDPWGYPFHGGNNECSGEEALASLTALMGCAL